jgi:hypothetical protein
MDTHKHGQLTFVRRLEMVKQMTIHGLNAAQAGLAQGAQRRQLGSGWVGI